MNAQAEQPDWLPIVEQCMAQDGKPHSLPSFEHLYGPGRWRVEPARLRSDGMVWHGLYWETGTKHKRSYRVGAFYLPAMQAPRNPKSRRDGQLTIGYDDCGRRLVKIANDHDGIREYNIVAIEWEVVRGVKLPRPVPVFNVEVP